MPQNSTVIYNVKKDVWTEAPSFNIARNAHSSCVVGSKVYIFGGEDVDGSLINTIESYDVEGPAKEEGEAAWDRINLEAVTPRIYSIVCPLTQSDAVIMGGDFKAKGGWHLYADVLIFNTETKKAERINAHAGLPVKSLSPGVLLNNGCVVALVRAPGNFLHLICYNREFNELKTLEDFGNI